jgi:hypothetical protein
MRKLSSTTFSMGNRHIPIVAGGVIVVLIILDLLATHQILCFDNASEITLFTLTLKHYQNSLLSLVQNQKQEVLD